MLARQEALVSVVDRVVGVVRCGDEELGVNKATVPVDDVVRRDGVHVVNQQLTVDLVALNTKVATKVSGNNELTSVPPVS